MGELSGKVAIVTGGTLGIGRAAAEGLALAGASVVVCGSRQEHLDAAVAELRARGLEVDGVVADVASAPDETERCAGDCHPAGR